MEARQRWLAALDATASFAGERPPDESGCLYYATDDEAFVVPQPGRSLVEQRIQTHFGAPGGVLPRLSDSGIEGLS